MDLRTCLVLTFLSACASTHREPGPAAPDSGTANPSEPHATNIIIENAGPEPLVLDTTCGGLWTSIVRDGSPLEIDRYCKSSCDTPDRAGCPASCLAADWLLLPGERKTFAWDGFEQWPARRHCYEPRALVPSTELTAQACWNSMPLWNSTGVCASTSFRYGDTDEVVIRAEPATTPVRSTRLALRNVTDHPIEIVSQRCEHQAVFGLFGESASLYVKCPCACSSESRERGCPRSDCEPCPADVVEMLQPGATFEFDWDHRFWYHAPGGCSFEHTQQPTEKVRMVACWIEPPSTETLCSSAEVGFSDEFVTFESKPNNRR